MDARRTNGYTLIETLLFIAGSGIVILSLSVMLSLLLQSRVQHGVITEVESTGERVSHLISQSIRSAADITTPLSAATSSTLSLVTHTSSTTPTVFEYVNNAILLTEGTGPALPLISSRIRISDLIFMRTTATSTLENIRFSFRLSHTNPSERNEYAYTQTFWGSASLR